MMARTAHTLNSLEAMECLGRCHAEAVLAQYADADAARAALAKIQTEIETALERFNARLEQLDKEESTMIPS